MSITLNITFLSDWHIGEGAGASGHIDRVVRRHPEDNLPYVPAKTLTGILRDACEKVAYGLDDGKDEGKWQQFVATLFGQQSKGAINVATTTPALVFIGPARFDPALRAALCDKPALKSALTFVKPGVKLDENGIAESAMLRFEEVVMAGAKLNATVELNEKISANNNVRKAVEAILAAGAKAVERIGAKRRRGNGRCCIKPDGKTVDFHSAFASDPPSLDIATDNGLELTAPTLSTETGWHIIPLDLELLAPVIIPSDTAGNVIGTRDHIPGSLLLPALDKKLRALLGEAGNNLTSHLAAGRIQIRNAYPSRNGKRLLPVPTALMAEKEAAGKITNALFGGMDDGIQRKQLRSGYVPETGLPQTIETKSPLTTAKTIATTHAVIDDDLQRPTSDVGGVYTYEAIAPGQIFRSELWIAQSVLSDKPKPSSFDCQLRIGRAKKDDYGLVKLTAGQVSDRKTSETNTDQIEKFTLWLASPLLARDARLRPITDAHALAAWLGLKLGVTLTPKSSFARSFRDDGWNNAWKEPRPSRFGLAAGSVFHFSTEKISAEKLAELELSGIGERRGEGYGEIRVNPTLLSKPIEAGVNAQENSGGGALQEEHKTSELSLPNSEFIQHLHKRAWRTGIRRQAMAQIHEFTKCLGWTTTPPSNSQLGALRSLFEQWSGPARLKIWLDHLKQTPNRKDKWPPDSLAILGQVASNDGDVWTRIIPNEFPLFSGVDRENLKNEMATEATRILWLTTIGAELDRRAHPKKSSNKPEGN